MGHLDSSADDLARGITFVNGRRADVPTRTVTLRQLVERGLVMGAGLKAAGTCPGDVVFIALPTGEDFIEAFIAAIFLGALPCAVPEDGSTFGHPFSEHVRATALSFSPSAIVGRAGLQQRLECAHDPFAATCVTPDVLRLLGAGHALTPTSRSPDDLLHLQLTSGSTAAPKAAALSHRAVISNIVLTADAGEGDVRLNRGMLWLPLFHDMGLISMLSSLYHNCDLVLQPPEDFILNPMSWMTSISNHRCTATAAPNFALAYCTRRFRPDLLHGVDLQCLRTLVVGAEKVHLSTLRCFADTFEPYGFTSDAFRPSYGTAELTLAVTIPRRRSGGSLGGHVRWDVRRPHLTRSSDDDEINSTNEFSPTERLVSLGEPLTGTVIEVRGHGGAVLPDGEAGEVFVRSPCVMEGYFQDPDATASVLGDGFYATGDFGYLKGGELYLVGRIKELIILRGRNYPPHEFEECALDTGRVDAGRVAAFGAADTTIGSEKLVLVIEPERYESLPALRLDIQQRLRSRFGFGASEIRFVKKGAIPRTTSRKVRRLECLRLYGEGALAFHAEEVETTDQI